MIYQNIVMVIMVSIFLRSHCIEYMLFLLSAAPDDLIILNRTTDGIIIETEGQMLNITCQAIGGNTKGNIYWRNVFDFESQITEVDEWPFAYLHLITDYKHHGMNFSCVVEHEILSAEMVASVIFHVLCK